MNCINHVVLLGQLTRTPQVRYTPEGQCVCYAGLGLTRRWRDGNGDTHQATTCIELTIAGEPGELVATYRRKGQMLAVEGRLELERWTNRLGETCAQTKVEVERVTFIEMDGPAAPDAESLPEWVKDAV